MPKQITMTANRTPYDFENKEIDFQTIDAKELMAMDGITQKNDKREFSKCFSIIQGLYGQIHNIQDGKWVQNIRTRAGDFPSLRHLAFEVVRSKRDEINDIALYMGLAQFGCDTADIAPKALEALESLRMYDPEYGANISQRIQQIALAWPQHPEISAQAIQLLSKHGTKCDQKNIDEILEGFELAQRTKILTSCVQFNEQSGVNGANKNKAQKTLEERLISNASALNIEFERMHKPNFERVQKPYAELQKILRESQKTLAVIDAKNEGTHLG